MLTREKRSEISRLGGWSRCRQHAATRRENPTHGEKLVRDVIAGLGLVAEYEYEIRHPNGMPQFFDVYLPTERTAIEVDGSHGFHGYNGRDEYGKMTVLDELKARYCSEHGIRLIRVNTSDRGNSWQDLEKLFQSIVSASH